jgi:hypothetical protein
MSLVQLRSQASTICARTNHQISAIATPAAATRGAAFLDSGIAALKPELSQLKQLSAPADVSDVWSTALRGLEGQLGALQTAAGQIGRGGDPVTAYRALQQALTPLETQANNAWQALAIPACLNQ